GAILLNGHRAGPAKEDFVSQLYRERSFDGDAPFPLSGTVLDEVYRERRPLMSNNITPVLCAPLLIDGSIRGVLYLEGRESQGGFEPDHLYHLTGIADFVIAAIRLAGKVESMRDAIDLSQEEHRS